MRSRSYLVLYLLVLAALIVAIVWKLPGERGADAGAESLLIQPSVAAKSARAGTTELSNGEQPSRARTIALPPGNESLASNDSHTPSKHLIGSVLDEVMEQPLPEYALHLECAGISTDVTTDPDGHFAVDLPCVEGNVTIDLIDHAELERRPGELPLRLIVALEPSPNAPQNIVLRVQTGPTFRLAFNPPDIVDKGTFDAALTCRQATTSWRSHRAPVRLGHPLWVRFAPLSADPSEIAIVHVERRGGIWKGEGKPPHSSRGVAEEIVSIQFVPRAALCIRVQEDSGRAVTDASVFLRRAGSSVNSGLRTTDQDGIASYADESAGDYLVHVETLQHEAREVPVHIEAGETTPVEAVLTRRAVRGSLEGDVFSDTGTYSPNVRLQIWSVSHNSAFQFIEPTWVDTHEGKRAHFAFSDLPDDRYKIKLIKHDTYTWSPIEIEARPPCTTLEFVAHDVPRVNRGKR